ncbi:MAG: TrmH family RNA methyltransferase [Chitinophagia bacterium]|nr:TrmH family RNA methyltransferase [Chitinophagia bacterium]
MEYIAHQNYEYKSVYNGIEIAVILENVRSMHNVGAIFRSCDAMGVNEVYLVGYTPQPPHRDIQKAALGATETVKWRYFSNIEEAILHAGKSGYSIAGIEQAHHSILLNQAVAELPPKVAIILGNEVDGVSDTALSLCNYCIEIPQVGDKHSFNIAVAAGIVLWELRRSRFSV